MYISFAISFGMEYIGVGRFRILGWAGGGGGRGGKVWNIGGPRGAKSQHAHDVVLTSMRRNDVASTSCAD